MPEGYTHVRTARNAAIGADIAIFNRQAFYAGANGPDLFFFYRAWSKQRMPDLPALGSRMHRELCGDFLLSLVSHAETPAQKGYALGFLCHYALDAEAHPYIAFLTGEGMPYHLAHGHGRYEIALDSALHKKDTGRRAVKAWENTGFLTGQTLAEVVALLRLCIQEVYGTPLSALALADCFHQSVTLRRFFCSPLRIKKALASLVELAVFHKRGFITCHMTPARLQKRLPDNWTNPYTEETKEGGMTAILTQAEARCALLMRSARKYWADKLSFTTLARHIGNVSYETGVSWKKAVKTPASGRARKFS